MRVIKSYKLEDIMTTSELSEKLGYNQSYILRLAKEHLTENIDFRSAGRRNYLFTTDALKKLKLILDNK